VQYNFLTVLNWQEIDYDEIVHKCHIFTEVGDKKTYECYLKILRTFSEPFEKEELLTLFHNLAEYKISMNIPYSIMNSHINNIHEFLLANVSSSATAKDIVCLAKLIREIKNAIAKHFFLQLIDNMIEHNKARKNSLNDLMETDLIMYYEAHLIWLTELAEHIKTGIAHGFPELNPTMCEFGKWLDSGAREVITNTKQYEDIYSNHQSLHLFGHKIYNIIGKGEYAQLITYLERSELISLNIGMELSLLDNTIISNKADRDSLTQVLNRNSLDGIFKNQYELSLKTNNSFVLAMCDLDFFKRINDTYGHLAGDYVLQTFVQSMRNSCRNSDIIFRYGGEEFLLILPSLKPDDGYNIAETIRKNFEKECMFFENKNIQCTVSIGVVAIAPQEQYSRDLLSSYIAIADERLYKAKRSGRNRVERD